MEAVRSRGRRTLTVDSRILARIDKTGTSTEKLPPNINLWFLFFFSLRYRRASWNFEMFRILQNNQKFRNT